MANGDGGSHSDQVSHGICPDCKNTFAFQEGVSLQQYIDSIPYPILFVDKDMRVSFGNAKACKILGKAHDAVTGRLYGEVFECSHSRLPEGCGRTICCSGCTIRRTVTQSFRTGEGQGQIPATLKQNGSDVSLQITTLNVGEIVLLRIDRFQQVTCPQELRRWPRYKIDVPVRLSAQRPTLVDIAQGRGRELGRGGMAVSAGIDVSLNEQVVVDFTPPCSEQPMSVTGFVRNRTGDTYGIEYITDNFADYNVVGQLESVLNTLGSVS
jgi:PilZ domain-containing protein/PAS domain-containing protein